jgi:hypothetical protein
MDHETLTMALQAYQIEAHRIEAAMAAIRQRLGGRTAPVIINRAKRKRHMSAQAIERIRAGQKKRWAAFHAKQKAAVKATPKAKISPKRKVVLVANMAKARAARGARKAA